MNIISSLNPAVNMVILAIGIVVWAFNTFAQITYVKEQNFAQMSYVKEQNAAMTLLIEARHKEALLSIETSRERVLGLLVDVKDSVKLLETRSLSATPLSK